MSLDNSTLPEFRAVELNTLALALIQEFALSALPTTAQISLSSLSFGVLTIIIGTSIYFLIYWGSAGRTNINILLLSTILLHTSTTIFFAAMIWSWSSRNYLLAKANDGLFSPSYNGKDDFAAFKRSLSQQSWMITTALIVNFAIGDAIVWWRACVIWRHKAVNLIGSLLVTLTIVCGIVGVITSPPDTGHMIPYFLLGTTKYALVSVVSSLATNVLATSLIAYQAWKHRRLLKQDFARGRTTSRILKALALLIESGCIYSLLLIFVAAYQADGVPSQAGPNLIFEIIGYNFIYGCLVPVVAIYPATIIVIVSLNRSPIDTGGLSQVHGARGRVSGVTVEGGASNTIVFAPSTLLTSVGVDTVSDTEGLPSIGNGWINGSLATSMREGEMKDVV